MTFLSPRQLGAMDDSDEEMQLINDVARLDSQLKQAGCPCDENLYVHLSRDLNAKPLAKRLKLWRFRKELLREKLVAFQLSRSTASGETAAASSPVLKQETERKRKFEEPPFEDPSAQLHDDKKKPAGPESAGFMSAGTESIEGAFVDIEKSSISVYNNIEVLSFNIEVSSIS